MTRFLAVALAAALTAPFTGQQWWNLLLIACGVVAIGYAVQIRGEA